MFLLLLCFELLNSEAPGQELLVPPALASSHSEKGWTFLGEKCCQNNLEDLNDLIHAYGMVQILSSCRFII